MIQVPREGKSHLSQQMSLRIVRAIVDKAARIGTFNVGNRLNADFPES
jgi:hypothetical protein